MFISLNNKCKACDSGPLYLYRNNISQEIQDGIQTMCWLCCGLRQTWRNVTHSNSNTADKLKTCHSLSFIHRGETDIWPASLLNHTFCNDIHLANDPVTPTHTGRWFQTPQHLRGLLGADPLWLFQFQLQLFTFHSASIDRCYCSSSS